MSYGKDLFALFLAVLVCSAFCQTPPDEKSTKSSASPPTSTTKVTTPPPTTTTAPSTTSTTKSSTTTTQPTTTATISPPPSSSTTSPSPTPPPEEPKVYNYTVHQANGTKCIILHAGISLDFTYATSDPKKNETQQINVTMPNKEQWHHMGGNCGKTNQSIIINFNKDWKLEMAFEKTKSDIVLSNVTLNFTMTKELFPKAATLQNYSASITNQSLLHTPISQGYRCDNVNTFKNFPNNTPLISISTYHFEVEAFRWANDTKFDADYTQCKQDNKISNIVPIAVGAALGALVLIVLIAYLVGRKRNQRGYESV